MHAKACKNRWTRCIEEIYISRKENNVIRDTDFSQFNVRRLHFSRRKVLSTDARYDY